MAEENSVTFSAPEQVTANDRPAGEKQTPAEDIEAKIAKVLEDKLSKFADEFGRKQQSLRKKQEDRIAKQVNAYLTAQQAAGVTMTNEQSQALESHIRKQVEAEVEQVEDAPTPKEDKADPVAEHVNRTIAKIFEKSGFKLEKNDPEAEGLDKVADPYEFIEEVRERIAKKAQRINTSPETRIPGMGAGYTPGSETEDTLGKKLLELLKKPNENWTEIQEVKAKLKKFNK